MIYQHATRERDEAIAAAMAEVYSTSLTDTLPPFPMCRALPGPEYYGGSARPQPEQLYAEHIEAMSAGGAGDR